jgi:DNA-binding transcriptional LysR family regulator
MAQLLDLRQVRTFVEVARARSFTKAAIQLHYAQSSVTAHVHALEKDLRVPLFNRLGRQVELTEAGRQFLSHAEKLISLAEDALLSIRRIGDVSGPLVVSASESLLTYRLPELLRLFQSTYPEVQLMLHTGASASTAPLEPGVDLAITIDEPVQVPQLLVQRVRKERMVTVAAAEHGMRELKRISAAEISEQQLLLTEGSCSYRALFERTLVQHGGRVNKLLEFASVEALKQCAVARMGVAVLPEFVVANELEQGTLIVLPWPQTRMHVYTQLVRHRDKWLSPAMDAFCSMATKLLRETST